MRNLTTRLSCLAIFVLLMMASSPAADANMEVTSIGFGIIQDFDGQNTEYGYSLWGLIDEGFSHVILKGPDPDGAGGEDPPVLADSRSGEFQPPTGDNNYLFFLYAGAFTSVPVTGDYTAEIYVTEVDPPSYTRTIPVETRHIPTETVEITYPTPSTFYTVLPFGFTWNPYPYDEEETIKYRFAIWEPDETIFETPTGSGTMGVYNGDPLPAGTYRLFVTPVVSYTPDSDPDFVYVREGNRWVDFGVSYVSDLDRDGVVDGIDLSTFASEYGLPD